MSRAQYYASKQQAQAKTFTPAPTPTEITQTYESGFSSVATTLGYEIMREGVVVALGTGIACVQTNAQRAAASLANRGVYPV